VSLSTLSTVTLSTAEATQQCSDSVHAYVAQFLQTEHGLRVPVLKWDTQIGLAPVSWALSRVWVLFLGYTWLPLLGYKVANLVVGVRLFVRELTHSPQALDVQPLDPDGAGGLSVLSTVASALVAPLIVFGVMLSLIFVKEHAEPSLHDLLLFVAFVPLVLAVFFLPLLSVHAAMKSSKDKALNEFSLLFNNLSHRLVDILHAESIDMTELTKLEAALRCLRENYDRLLRMPVWPFGLPRLFGLVSAIAATTIPLLIQILMKAILH